MSVGCSVAEALNLAAVLALEKHALNCKCLAQTSIANFVCLWRSEWAIIVLRVSCNIFMCPCGVDFWPCMIYLVFHCDLEVHQLEPDAK